MSSKRTRNLFKLDEDDGDQFNDRRRYGKMDNYEYEMPDEYEDEEIESSEAFNEDDEAAYGRHFARSGTQGGGEDDEDDDDDDDEEDYPVYRPEDDEDDEEEDVAREGLLRALESNTTGGSGSVRRSSGTRVRGGGQVEGAFDLVVPREGDGTGLAEIAEALGTGEDSRVARQQLRRLERGSSSTVPLGSEAGKRVERKVAYSRSRKSMRRWQPQVEKETESRTLQLGEERRLPTMTTAALAEQSDDEDEEDEVEVEEEEEEEGLEGQIKGILRRSGANESNLERAEELAMHRLSVEEVAARAAQLAKMRSLMFHQELRAKRQSKIKSRKYRKMLKKQKERWRV